MFDVPLGGMGRGDRSEVLGVSLAKRIGVMATYPAKESEDTQGVSPRPVPAAGGGCWGSRQFVCVWKLDGGRRGESFPRRCARTVAGAQKKQKPGTKL